MEITNESFTDSNSNESVAVSEAPVRDATLSSSASADSLNYTPASGSSTADGSDVSSHAPNPTGRDAASTQPDASLLYTPAAQPATPPHPAQPHEQLVQPPAPNATISPNSPNATASGVGPAPAQPSTGPAAPVAPPPPLTAGPPATAAAAFGAPVAAQPGPAVVGGTLVLGDGSAGGLRASQSSEATDHTGTADRVRAVLPDPAARVAVFQGVLHSVFESGRDLAALAPAVRSLGEALFGTAPGVVRDLATGPTGPEVERALATGQEIVSQLGGVVRNANAQLGALMHQKPSTLASVSAHFLQSYLGATVGQLRDVAYGESPSPLDVAGTGLLGPGGIGIATLQFAATVEHTLGVPNVGGIPASVLEHLPLAGAVARDSIERLNAADAHRQSTSQAAGGGVGGVSAAALLEFNSAVNPFYQLADHGSRIVAAGRSGDWNTVADHAIGFLIAATGVRDMVHAAGGSPETRNPIAGGDPSTESSPPTSISPEPTETRDTIVDPVPAPTVTTPPSTPPSPQAGVPGAVGSAGHGEPSGSHGVETGTERPTLVPGDVSAEQAARAGRALAALELGHRPSTSEVTRMIERVQDMGDVAQRFDSEQAARDTTSNPRSIRECDDPREFRAMWAAAGGGQEPPPRAFATTNGATFIDQSRTGSGAAVTASPASPPTPPAPAHVSSPPSAASDVGTAVTQLNLNPAPAPRPIPVTRPGTVPPVAVDHEPVPARDMALAPRAADRLEGPRPPDSFVDSVIAHELAERPATQARVNAAMRDLRQGGTDFGSERDVRQAVNSMANAARNSVDRVYTQPEANELLRSGDRYTRFASEYEATWHLTGGAPEEAAPPAFRTSDGQLHVWNTGSARNSGTPTATPVGVRYQPADLAEITNERSVAPGPATPQPAPSPVPAASDLGTAPTQLNLNPAPAPRPIPATRPGTVPPAV